MGVLLQVSVEELPQGQERTVIVSETITFHNLHRCIQYCIRPKDADSDVDAMVSRLDLCVT